MCAKSRKSSKAIDRPFARDVLRRTAELARQYQVILELEDGQWFGRGLELPGAMGDGKTPDECVSATRSAIISAVASMLEDGGRPPTPASSGLRSMQVNVRLTAEEKRCWKQPLTAADLAACRISFAPWQWRPRSRDFFESSFGQDCATCADSRDLATKR